MAWLGCFTGGEHICGCDAYRLPATNLCRNLEAMKHTCLALIPLLAGCASAAPSLPATPPPPPAEASVVEPASPESRAPPPATTEADLGPPADLEPSRDSDAAIPLGFTVEQANAGRDLFRASCTACHSSSELSDRTFKFKWRRRTAGDLFGYLSTTMPEDAPGALAPTEYAALVAYMLRLNGFEAGTDELPADEDALEALSLSPLGSGGDRR